MDGITCVVRILRRERIVRLCQRLRRRREERDGIVDPGFDFVGVVQVRQVDSWGAAAGVVGGSGVSCVAACDCEAGIELCQEGVTVNCACHALRIISQCDGQ